MQRFFPVFKISEHEIFHFIFYFLISVRKALAINAGRKNKNTSTVLKKALEGAISEGSKTELINLHDYFYSGCKGCIACKNP